MTYGRELRTVFFHSPPALNLLLRKELALLQARMRTTGQRFGRFRRTLADGTYISVTVNLNGPVPLFVVRATSHKQASRTADEYYPLIELESGMLLVTRDGWTMTPPFDVAIGSRLADYFSSPGTSLLCGGSVAYNAVIQGKGTAKNNCIQFPARPPAADNPVWPLEDGRYQSHIFVRTSSPVMGNFLGEAKGLEPEYTKSTLYTGLMRLAVQSWVGAGVHPDDIRPYSLPDPGTELPIYPPFAFDEGLLLGDDYQVWWVLIMGGAVYFAPLKLSPAAAVLKSLLQATAWEDTEDRTWLLSLYLSQLKGCELTEIVAVPVPGLADALSFGSPIAFGWHFSRGLTAERVREADIVLWTRVREGLPENRYYYATQQWHLKFKFSEATPAVTLTQSQDTIGFKIKADLFPLWVPMHPFGYAQVWDWPADDFSQQAGHTAALYSYFDSEDRLQVLEFTSPKLTIIPGSGKTVIVGSKVTCGSSTAEWQQYTSSDNAATNLIAEGGFRFSPFDFPQSIVVGSYNGIYASVSAGAPTTDFPSLPPTQINGVFNEGPNGWYWDTNVQSLQCNGPNAAIQGNTACAGGCASADAQAYNDFVASDWGGGGRYYRIDILTTNTGHVESDRINVSGRQTLAIALVSQFDAEAIYCAFLDSGTRNLGNTHYERDTPTDWYCNARPVRVKYRLTIAKNCDKNTHECTDFVQYIGDYGVGWGTSIGGNANSFIEGYPCGSETSLPSGAYKTCRSALVTSTRKLTDTSQNYSDWSDFGWGGIYYDTRVTLFTSESSFHGDTYYNVSPYGEAKLISGYPALDTLVGTKRWIGNV